MKSNAFLSHTNKHFGLSFDRLQKLATALRSAGLYPDGRSNDHVTVTQAAHLLRLLAIAPTPLGDEVETVVKGYKKLKSSDGNYFILDLAELLSESGLCLPTFEGKTNAVHHVSISLDRPFALIAFQEEVTEEFDVPGIDGLTYKRTAEKLYGNATPRQHERFAILKRSMLWELGGLLQQTGFDSVGDDLTKREELLTRIKTLK